MSEHNSKQAFVRDVIAALVKHGDGRYDWMAEKIGFYELDSGMQIISDGYHRYDVTCDSLTSILDVIHKLA